MSRAESNSQLAQSQYSSTPYASGPSSYQQSERQKAQQQSQSPISSPSSSSAPQRRHICPTCGRAFTTSGNLARHSRSQHENRVARYTPNNPASGSSLSGSLHSHASHLDSTPQQGPQKLDIDLNDIAEERQAIEAEKRARTAEKIQAIMAERRARYAEGRRRRRRHLKECFAAETKVDINQTIGELASLIPEFEPVSSILEAVFQIDMLSSKRKNSDVYVDECDNVGDVARKVAFVNSRGKKIEQKGIILTRSVEYIRYLQGLVKAQVARNRELEAELKVYRAAAGVLSSSSIRSAGVHDLDPVSVTGGPPGQPQPHLFNNQDYRRLHQNSMQDISRTPELSVGDESGHDRNHQSLTGHHRCNDNYCHTRHLSVSPSHAPYIPHPPPRLDNEYAHTAFTSNLHSSTPMSIVSSPSQSDSDARPASKTTMNPSKRRRMSTDSASEPSSSPASYGSLDNFSNKSSVTSNSVQSFMDYPFSSYSPFNRGNSSPDAQSNKPRNWENSSSMTYAFPYWSDSRSPIKNWSRPGSAQSGSSGGRSDSP